MGKYHGRQAEGTKTADSKKRKKGKRIKVIRKRKSYKRVPRTPGGRCDLNDMSQRVHIAIKRQENKM